MKNKRSSRQNIPLFIVCLAIPLLVGVAGSLVTFGEISGWYSALEKPFFNPPNWLFGPVWVLLYILQGLALYELVRAKRGEGIQWAIVLFSSHLGLNFAWSLIFFGFHDIIWALVEIAIYFIVLVITMREFYKHSQRSAQLLLPTVVWVGFATLLNAAIVMLNF